MVKTTNDNKVQYVAPKMKEFEVKVCKGVLAGSDGIEEMDTEDLGWNN